VAVLVLTVVALFLFTRDRIPLESSSLTILIILVAGFQLFPYARDGDVLIKPIDFFAGFGSEALIAICALMMVGKALETTGALQPLATVVGRAWSRSPVLALLATLVAGAILSAFMNNTPIVVLLMPILVGASIRSKFPVSGVMMPMGLATIIGGMSTTIGTSTNLLVVGIAQDMGQHTFTLFEWVLPVSIVGGGAILFLWLVAPRLLPDRTPLMSDTTPRVFSGQLHIKKGGFADGSTAGEAAAGRPPVRQGFAGEPQALRTDSRRDALQRRGRGAPGRRRVSARGRWPAARGSRGHARLAAAPAHAGRGTFLG
jgi:di/tricarboxylate transporter